MKRYIFCYITTLLLLFTIFSTHPAHAITLFTEGFSYPDNTSPAPNWQTLRTIYNPTATPVSQVFNNDGTEANWEVKDEHYMIHITQRPELTAVRAIPTIWPNIQGDYEIEFDMNLLNGINHDRSFAFRYLNENNHYVIHSHGTGIVISKIRNGLDESSLITSNSKNYNFVDNSSYHFKISLMGNKIVVYINGIKVFDSIDTGTIISSGKIALNAVVGSSSGGDVWFDNILVSSVELTDLNVPLLKQTAEPWQSNIYDTANKWSPENPTINAYGCALTTAAMVFQYHGITKLPDSTILDPGTLNDWLNSQEDGYVGEGLVNWLALSRLSKKAKQSGNNPNFTRDALEFRRTNGLNNTLLTNDINNNQPDILRVPGHFVVAKGINDDTFNINDPFYNRETLNDGYANAYSYIGRFIPSNTDLSYILVVVDQDVDIVMKDSNGNDVGSVNVEEPIDNASGNGVSNAKSYKLLYFETPPAGNYQVMINGSTSQIYEMNTFLYSAEGEVVSDKFQGVIGDSAHDAFILEYDPENTDFSNTSKAVTFDMLRNDIHELRELNMIKSETYAKVLLLLVGHAEKNVEKGREKVARLELNAFKKLVPEKGNKLITQDAAQILRYDVDSLLNSL